MKLEELNKLKEKVKELQSKREEVLAIKNEIAILEETEEIKRYLYLFGLYKEKKNDKNIEIDKLTDKRIVTLALGDVKITPDEEIYVYIGTYKYNYEIDIVHSSNDHIVSRNDSSADYVLYVKLESKYGEQVQIPYNKADEFEATHKIIVPKNALSRFTYFYDLQEEYFETMVLEGTEAAKKMINKLIK